MSQAPSLTVRGMGRELAAISQGSRSAELCAALHAAWSRCIVPAVHSDVPDAGEIRLWLGGPGDEIPESLERDGSELASNDLATLISAGTQAITHALIRAQVGRLLMLHAGAVSHPVTGRTLVFVAGGGTGKTTLARTLGRRYGYVTDETVGIAADGRVLPYPKPLSLRTEAGRPKAETSPDDLGLLPAHPDPTVAQVVILARDPEASVPRLQELGLLDAIGALTPQSSSLYALPRGLHRCADLIAATRPVVEVTYDEAESLFPLVEGWIGAA